MPQTSTDSGLARAPKSTVAQIRERFDGDVERFSDLQTGQAAAPGSPQCMELVTEAAAKTTPRAEAVLDVGCGAGNYTLTLLKRMPGLNVTLVDLSGPMLDRANQRVADAGAGEITTHQTDIREIHFAGESFDVILAAATLHHLREETEWRHVFESFSRWLRPGGSLWIVDMIHQISPVLQQAMWQRFGNYLTNLGGEAYRDKVLAYIDKEDTPRPLLWQLRLLESCGFEGLDILHRNLCMAAFGGSKSA